MSSAAALKPDYGNWVGKNNIYVPGVAGLVFLGLALLLPILAVLAALCLLVAGYFAYARYRFSPRGGGVEDRIRALVPARLEWDGRGQALDIGCGNGPLVIALAQKYPGARVTGIDYWGAQWEYAQSACERNAQVAGVTQRVTFQKASAASLPFADGTFDAVVSNLVFHEVNDARDKRALIREALRVLRKGGKFAFQDLFLIERVYGSPDELLAEIRSWGISRVELTRTRDEAFIPAALKLPFMVGTMAILSGEK